MLLRLKEATVTGPQKGLAVAGELQGHYTQHCPVVVIVFMIDF